MLKAIAGILAALAIIGAVVAQQTRPASGPVAPAELIPRGRYLVHHVAMCVECHTPRSTRGELVMGRLLQGARMPVDSPFPGREWCFETPAIAGLPGWSDEEAVRFLMTGLDYRGYTARPPMPAYRMTREDAQAVVAYLRSLR